MSRAVNRKPSQEVVVKPASEGEILPELAPRIVSEILKEVSRTGNLSKACRGIVSPTDFCELLREREAAHRLDDARRIYAESLMDELLDLADADISVKNAPSHGDDGVRAEWLQLAVERRKRQIDARKFVAEKMMPAKSASVNIDARRDNRSVKQTFLGAAMLGRK